MSERGFKAKYTFEDIIYQSQSTHQTIETARRYSESDSNVIIVGETGTGKELFAQSIHNSSSRKNRPFVASNCAARKTFWKASCLDMWKALLPALVRAGKWDSLSLPTEVPFFWMK